jgi:hypothetical protein
MGNETILAVLQILDGYPGSWFFPSRFEKQQQKRRGKKLVVPLVFFSHKYHTSEICFNFEQR